MAFTSFVKAWSVSKHHDSKHLISHNVNNSTYRFKRTICIDICPVCRDDLVLLPRKVAQAMGGVPSLMICTRAMSSLRLIDPASLRAVEVSPVEYFKRPFVAACTP